MTTKLDIFTTTHPECGATLFDGTHPPIHDAQRLASHHYDYAEIEQARDKGGAYYAVKVGRWYRAMVGTIEGNLAILHKLDDGSRELTVYNS